MPFLQEFFTMLKKMVMARSVDSVDLIILVYFAVMVCDFRKSTYLVHTSMNG